MSVEPGWLFNIRKFYQLYSIVGIVECHKGFERCLRVLCCLGFGCDSVQLCRHSKPSLEPNPEVHNTVESCTKHVANNIGGNRN